MRHLIKGIIIEKGFTLCRQVHDDAETVVQQAKEIAEYKGTVEILNADLKYANG